ncbi:MAG: BatA domain-containing protein, partial [Hoeflea sp.]|nr:BatA domain-containing protein [Hoeflea sp.]
MIAGLPIAFGAPAILIGLLALPVIWWLLRLTPPRPQAEPFAPMAILALVLKTEETPARSPWWLTLLRLLIAALVILALSEPVLNPRDQALSVDGPLALVIDNGWASAPDWEARTEAAELLISEAEDLDIPVSIIFTADRRHDATPGTVERAREQLRAAGPRPLRPERGASVTALIAALGQTRPGTIAYLSDGIDTDDATEALNQLAMLEPSAIRIIGADGARALALTNADNGAEALTVSASRLETAASENFGVTARDGRGRQIAAGEIRFEAGSNEASSTISAPFEIRNDIARLDVTGIDTAGSVRLLDDSFRRRRVALVSGEASDIAQPLLSPLYYINRALSPYADLIEADSADMSAAIPRLLAQSPAVMVMADIGILPDDVSGPLNEWIERGGTLIRFAGPRLAAAPAGDPLAPVLLRKGERELGGALSWIEPQPLADYPTTGPFAGLPTPRDVTVSRQVLAEPSADLAARTWASLADGTPLVTAAERGAGRIVLFHVTAEAGWSNLPISGHFVDMLRRVVQLSRAVAGGGEAGSGILPPWRLLDAKGALAPASGDAKPLNLSAGATARVSSDNPPGLYGAEDGFAALNLFAAGDSLATLDIPEFEVPVTRVPITRDSAVDFRPWLFGAALLALLADTLIVLLLNGAFRRKSVRSAPAAAAMLFAALVSVSLLSQPDDARAQDAQP